MNVYLTLTSESDQVVRLVSDFARGLGCAVEMVPASVGWGTRIQVPDTGHTLVELLTHVALSATKAGVDVAEPLCQVSYRHEGVASQVKLALRVAEFNIDAAVVSGA